MRRSALPAALGWMLVSICLSPFASGSASEPQRSTDPPSAAAQIPPARANDNRTAAGRLRDGILTLHLDVITAAWSPDGNDGATRITQAFAEEGQAPQIPGPLIRVPEGTEIRLTVRNRLANAAVKIFGVMTRPGDDNSAVSVEAGASREVRFTAGKPGTYAYWASSTGLALDRRLTLDSQLSGAFVVDPAAAPIDDRIFVLTEWLDLSATPARVSEAINGASWPHTDRLKLPIGEPVTWRVINGSATVHPMHLHGTFYTVTSKGSVGRDVIYGTGARRLATTEVLEPGSTMTMRWTPDRLGNWLFHCHILAHVSGDMKLGDLSPEQREHAQTHAEHDIDHAMAGLVIGITVVGEESAVPITSDRAPRRLTMTMQETRNRYGAEPGYSFALSAPDALPDAPPPIRPAGADPGTPPPRRIAPNPSPTLVLTRGEPVVITLVNQLQKGTQIHWHGMELDSYNDGVAGWSGTLRQVTPVIQPNDRYEARFTPPRAGTFIYHTHSHDQPQLLNGLYGAMIVGDPARPFDANIDRVVLIGGPAGRGAQGLEVNRSSNPPPMDLKVGVTYRFRVINITANVGAVVSLLGDSGAVEWKAVAKDGADLPASQSTIGRARQRIGVGETYDFEFQPRLPGDMRLEVLRIAGNNSTVTTTLVRVSP